MKALVDGARQKQEVGEMVPAVVLIMAGSAMVVGGSVVMKLGQERLPDGPVADAAQAVIGLLTNRS